ncbi:DgyrCDS8917 [Dimorphilus gyrociliatus]|uniref:DgyrCDS8917 n=1 Tax=Dimorphilus gyrociliatus TaxID=2664684 RepID=A0A7I8VVU2_9ANNE|nr:DgyrCDS8917 [Dimorphilus gyrociliatus]
MNNFRDRTGEFQSVIKSISSKQQLNNGSVVKPVNKLQQRSQFMQVARKIGRDLAHTCEKLEKLSLLVKRKSLFDDQPMEIQELTYIIKQDINQLNSDIDNLQKFSREKQSNSRHKQLHSSTVVISLQSRLANVSCDLKNVLETRTESMKEQKARREQFTQPQRLSSAPPAAAEAKHSLIMKDEAAAQAAAANSQNGLVSINMDTSSSHGSPQYQQQLQLIEQQDAYIQDRADDMKKVEETIVELGSIFEKLAVMIHEQEEMVQRIDSNVENTQLNVEAAHSEILKYFQSVTSNRWLMIKVFGILIFFFIIFVVLVA